MKVHRFLLAVAISMLGAFLLSGCASRLPLSPQEKATIRTICVASDLGNELQYVRIGTTVFGNNTDNIPDNGILSGVVDETRKAIASRGYKLSKSQDTADYLLRVGRSTTNNYPSGRGVAGAGFFVHTVLGINEGISAEALITFELINPKTGKLRSARSVCRMRMTPIKKAPFEWSGLSAQEHQTLLDALKSELKGIGEEGVREIGL